MMPAWISSLAPCLVQELERDVYNEILRLQYAKLSAQQHIEAQVRLRAMAERCSYRAHLGAAPHRNHGK